FVKNLGKRIANVSIGITAAKGVGYVGLVLGAASGVNNIYEACKVDSTGSCGKTTSVEIGGFIGGLGGGTIGGKIGVVLALSIAGAASAPIIAIATISGFVFGGAIGGIIGSTTGKAGAEFIYEHTLELMD
ncbi:hypothetical protein AB6Q85_003665, partial [Vibrio cholerae]